MNCSCADSLPIVSVVARWISRIVCVLGMESVSSLGSSTLALIWRNGRAGRPLTYSPLKRKAIGLKTISKDGLPIQTQGIILNPSTQPKMGFSFSHIYINCSTTTQFRWIQMYVIWPKTELYNRYFADLSEGELQDHLFYSRCRWGRWKYAWPCVSRPRRPEPCLRSSPSLALQTERSRKHEGGRRAFVWTRLPIWLGHAQWDTWRAISGWTVWNGTFVQTSGVGTTSGFGSVMWYGETEDQKGVMRDKALVFSIWLFVYTKYHILIDTPNWSFDPQSAIKLFIEKRKMIIDELYRVTSTCTCTNILYFMVKGVDNPLA